MIIMGPDSMLYGLLAEFKDLDPLIEASRQVREKGYRKIDAYSPFPSEDLMVAIGHHKNSLSKFVFCGGLTGVISGFSMQYIASVLHYPWRVGGKPFNSWPAFIPISYECMILGAALTAVFGMFIMNGLPMHYHPLFNIREFEKASKDGFFLSIESTDGLFNLEETKAFLQSLGPVSIYEVPK
jgi:hypothetical protein